MNADMITAIAALITAVAGLIWAVRGKAQSQVNADNHDALAGRVKALEQPETPPLLPGGIMQNRGMGEMPQFTDQPKGSA